MLSRAKHGMYVLGSKITIEKYEATNLSKPTPSPETLISKVFEAQNLIFDHFETLCQTHQTSTLIYSNNDWKKLNQVAAMSFVESVDLVATCVKKMSRV
ncbi:hypothetical protein GEMRC1_008870 [Eukaryota sp. GEM-RC1]